MYDKSFEVRIIAILALSPVETMLRAFGSRDAVTTYMNARKIRPTMREDRKPVVLGAISWIADELIGIRRIEQGLCRRLRSRTPQNSNLLLTRIRDLNSRVELLDRALDEYSKPATRG